MAHLVGDIAKYFKIEEIDIDNIVFKLFYQGCVIVFFTGSMVGVMSQYFGEPINCDFKGIDGELASDFCWIHGSSYIEPQYQEHMKCIVDLDGVKSKDEAPDTSYYQWVTFVLLIQAGFFIFPYKVWKLLEGGLMEQFGTDGKSAILLSEEAKYEDGVIMESVVEKFVKYYRSTFHHNQMYFTYFVCMEFLNIIMLFANFWATDKFLNGNFKYYGWNAIKYYMMTPEEQKVSVNPLCQAFPTEVSCDVPNMGAAGGMQNSNGLCILSQNIINEKMYLFIWFWLVMLIFVSVPYFMFRICTIFFDYVRYALIISKCGRTNDPDVPKAIRYIMKDAYVGDWFVLHQLSKNVNTYFFREFVKELRVEMKDRPKRSRGKRGKDGTLSRKNSRMVKTNLNHMPSIGTLEHSKRSGDQDTLRIPLRDAAQLNADDSDPNI
jgi:hypothetical protein